MRQFMCQAAGGLPLVAPCTWQGLRCLAGVVGSRQQCILNTAPIALLLPACRYKGPGSVEHTIRMLEAYCNWLENRVVSWFDRAAAEKNLAVMAEVVRIMAGGGGSAGLAVLVACLAARTPSAAGGVHAWALRRTRCL